MAESEPKPAPADPQPAATAGAEVVITNDQEAPAAYANFARVTGTPEELILDFALNPNPFGSGRQELRVSQRLILNHFTAKRLLAALSATLQRHESAFGSIELDVRRRVAGAGALAAKK